MVRVIMAAVGILFICLGGSGVDLGILLLLPGVITVIVKIVKAITRKVEYEEYYERMEAERRERELAEERRKQEAIEEQRILIERFKNSQITQDVLSSSNDTYICKLCNKQFAPDDLQVKYTCKAEYGEEYKKCPIYKDRKW